MRGNHEKRYNREENGSQDDHQSEERRHPRRGGHGRREHHKGAKTFRRGRAIEFLDRMNIRRTVLKQQLDSPELQSINPILVGELKAIETVIAEFTQLFDLHPDEAMQKGSVLTEKVNTQEDPIEE